VPDILTSDLHLSDNPRNEYRFQFFEQRLPKIMKQYGGEDARLLLLGDLTDQKDYHSARLVNRIMDGLTALAQIGPVVWLRGNHDYDKDAQNPFFAFSRYARNISFINTPTEQDGELYLPHSRNPEIDWRGWQQACGDVKIIFAHQTFTGAKGNNGMPLGGVEPPSKTIPVVSGDVHGPQKIGNITYVGAPYTVHFGDEYEPRLLIRRGLTLISLKLKGPQKRVLEVDAEGLGRGDIGLGDIVRIKVTLARADYDRWASIRDGIRNKVEAELRCVVESVVPMVEVGDIGTFERRRRGPQSDAQTLSEYCKKYQVDEATRKQGEELL
jgi:hypothetical protein